MDGPDPRGDEGARPILTGIERGIVFGGAGRARKRCHRRRSDGFV